MKNFSSVATSVKIAAVASVALILSEIDASAAEVRFLCGCLGIVHARTHS
jgi:hypothetical protein